MCQFMCDHSCDPFDTALRLGLKQYFASHAYGNATGADLWQALTQKTELDLPKIMATWLNCPGYPVVSVKKIDLAVN